MRNNKVKIQLILIYQTYYKGGHNMYLVFDIGGTFTKYALMDDQGHIQSKNKIPTIRNDINTFLDHLETIYKNHSDVTGIAISCPGLVDVNKGIIYGGGAVTCLDQVNLMTTLSKRCDNKPVAVENDGKCAGLAEAWIGAAKDVDNCCVLAFGTGVAGAIIKDKKIHRGNHLVAGEASYFISAASREDITLDYFGHKYSTIGIIKKAELALGKEQGTLSGEELFELAHHNNPVVNDILEDFYFNIAIQCYNLQYVFDPDLICIGGGISEQPAVIEGINRYVTKIYENTKQFLKPEVCVCQFNNDSNLIGALYNYKQLHN